MFISTEGIASVVCSDWRDNSLNRASPSVAGSALTVSAIGEYANANAASAPE